MRNRLPKRLTLAWIIKHFGIGGFENYTPEQQEAYLHALATILEYGSSMELYSMARILRRLASKPGEAEEVLQSLKELGF